MPRRPQHACAGHAAAVAGALAGTARGSLEAYIANSDPTAPLKDTNGNQVVGQHAGHAALPVPAITPG